MEAARIIKRIASYLLFIVAATFFFYQMVVLSTAMYIEYGEDFNAYLIANVFRPLMYVIVSLALMLVAEFALIGKDGNRYVTSLMLMVLFGVALAVSIYILVKGIISIPNNKVCVDPTFLYLVIFPLIGICLLEVIYGFILHLADKKEKAILKEKEKEESLEQDGVKLTKE